MTIEPNRRSGEEPHILTITCSDANEDGDCTCLAGGDPHGLVVGVECPGVTDACRTYVECAPCNATTDPEIVDALEEDEPVHGAMHIHGEHGWMAESPGNCWVQCADEEGHLVDAVRAMFAPVDVPLGRFRVLVEAGDPLALSLVTSTGQPS